MPLSDRFDFGRGQRREIRVLGGFDSLKDCDVTLLQIIRKDCNGATFTGPASDEHDQGPSPVSTMRVARLPITIAML